MNSKMNELQLKEKACKSLLANVLDMDDDLRLADVDMIQLSLILSGAVTWLGSIDLLQRLGKSVTLK